MLRFLTERMIGMVLTLFLVSIMVFVIM